MSRFVLKRLLTTSALCTLLVFGVGASELFAQPAGKPAKTIEDVSVTTRDGWQIPMTYYKSDKGKESPVVILLHRKGGNRLVWRQPIIGPQKKGFAEILQEKGYAVLAVDLRKHGESKGAGSESSELTPFDYERMVTEDLEAVKGFIYEENQKQNLNMRKTAIIAPEMSAPVALNFAYLDWMKRPYNDNPVRGLGTPRGQDVRALILLSPESSLPKLPTALPLREFTKTPSWGVAFLFAVSTEDSLDKGSTRQMFTQAGGKIAKGGADEKKEGRVHLLTYDAKWRGTDLLGKNLNLEPFILAFLDLHLKNLPDTWNDRQSKLTR